ncbi:hypothetical protein AMS68_002739 [Peltaster fructicola]|uniref:Myb-like domain-containing protein n=1 Tax=Peltaster fructicola TaxID=286661 RepID=A0A6H0XR25_9PEZI|nr:hypothetical protein AMS68_002739 [Peltaster fructicola]
MPKESKAPSTNSMHWAGAPYPQAQAVQPSASTTRSAAIWSPADDEILLHARASGLNWQPIASRHFPNKTANACRKRHERLVERRHAEDWDSQKLELLAQEYMSCRREMWEVLAARLGERWNVVEAKCMEKGLKTLQSTARTAHRRASASYSGSFEEPGSGNSDHHSDSGIGLGSDAEMEVGDDAGPSTITNKSATTWSGSCPRPQQASQSYMDHARSQSLPIAIPMYRPPPPITQHRRTIDVPPRSLHPEYSTTDYRSAPQLTRAPQRGISIQSVLAPTEV